MKTLQYFVLGLKSLKERTARSWITVFGIVVSIAVIFILLTLSAGLNIAVVELFEEFGTNRIYILGSSSFANPVGLGAQTLTQNDLSRIERLPFFETVIEGYAMPMTVTNRNTNIFTNVFGIPNTDIAQVDRAYGFTNNLIEGRFWTEGQRKVAILGYSVARDPDNFFGREINVRNTISINGTTFRVIGIYRQTGSPPDDRQIYIPLEDLRELTGDFETINFLDAVVRPGVDINVAKERIERELRRTRGEGNFLVITPEAILRQFQQTTGIIQSLLLAIASISMLVGAIGIANTMFTAVLERQKEIGIMKAVGASNQTIMKLFLVESGLIGTVGGIVGIILGIGISLLIGEIAANAGFELLVIEINIMYVIFCLAFAFIVGVISGALPSYIASRKKIVDVLRD